MSKKCIILMSNQPFLEKAKATIEQLRSVGKYNGDIVLLIGDDLKNEYINVENVIVKYFPDIDRSSIVELLKSKPISDGREINKTFQWHKLHVFDTFFKMWNKCLYIDAGMHIFKPIDKILGLNCSGKLVAHSDSYPTYEWKLKDQFDSNCFPDLYKELCTKFDLESDYFQTGAILFDTKIIDYDTKVNLIDLSQRYINSKTNEQGIMNLYFMCIEKLWKAMPIRDVETYYYDYWERNGLEYNNYIMLKYPKSIGLNNKNKSNILQKLTSFIKFRIKAKL